MVAAAVRRRRIVMLAVAVMRGRWRGWGGGDGFSEGGLEEVVSMWRRGRGGGLVSVGGVEEEDVAAKRREKRQLG